MSRAGFILVGGRSSRMGRDKALLPFGNCTLVEHLARVLLPVTGTVSLVGSPGKYGHFGYPVVPDLMPDAGPLAGIASALNASTSEWNLILACDMPGLETAFLSELLDAAEAAGADCFLPAGPSGQPEPLCAVYHRRALSVIRRALEQDVRRVQDALADLHVRVWDVPKSLFFQNLNTPREWASFRKTHHP